MRTAAMRATQSTQGVERALGVLDIFIRSDSRTLGITELAQATGLSKAVVYRILAACRAKDYIGLDATTHRYFLGPRALMLGLSYLDRLDMKDVAKPAMERLVEQTHETATLSVRAGWSRVYVDQVTPNQDVKMVVRIGRPFPLHAGASSKALLAFLSPEEIDTYLTSQELVALTERTLTDREAIREELSEIREQGYAVSAGERDASAASVAAPLRDHNGAVVGVMSVSGPIERFGTDWKRSADLLLKAVDSVSGQLGYRDLRH